MHAGTLADRTDNARLNGRVHLIDLRRGVPDEVLGDIRARDERDMGRDAAPLVQADDALLLDTSAMDVDSAVAEAIRLVEAALTADA